ELVTPTGAAILAAVAAPGPVTLRAHAHGAGAGSFDPPGRPNALRLFVGEAAQEGISVAPAAAGGALATRRLALLEANIDDMTPALLANARDRLLEEGALDAWLEPLAMKKGRAANKLCALVAAGEEPRYAALFLGETTTLGVRTTPYLRYEAERCVESFASSLGEVRVKVARWPGGERRTPEFEDVKALAAQLGRPALEVQRQLERELG
ncbi:MAG: nickel insertion protein, partial [Tepidiformaceae bacterium]